MESVKENVTVKTAYDEFISAKIREGLAQATIEDYENMVKMFVTFVGPIKTLDQIGDQEIAQYAKHIVTRKLSKATRATYIRHVKIFLCWLIHKKYPVSYTITALKVPKTPKRSVRIYTDDEVAQIFSAVSCREPWLEKRNRAILALMYDSGLRQGEVCELLRQDILSSTNQLRVIGKGSKKRYVVMGTLTKKLLDSYADDCPYQSKYMFLKRNGEQLTCKAIKCFMAKLSKQLPFELCSHALRHNFGTNWCVDQLEKRGYIDIYSLMYIMGHENIETTRYYLHFAQELLAGKSTISHLDLLMDRNR